MTVNTIVNLIMWNADQSLKQETLKTLKRINEDKRKYLTICRSIFSNNHR